MKATLAFIIVSFIGGLTIGVFIGSEHEKGKAQEKTSPAPATVVQGANAVYRDQGRNVYIPLTMEECNEICTNIENDSPGLSIKGAGNALDNT